MPNSRTKCFPFRGLDFIVPLNFHTFFIVSNNCFELTANAERKTPTSRNRTRMTPLASAIWMIMASYSRVVPNSFFPRDGEKAPASLGV
jgi:hypothetical protein